MHASAQPLVLRSSRAHQRTHSKTRPCTRTHDTHAYTHPAEEAARVAGCPPDMRGRGGGVLALVPGLPRCGLLTGRDLPAAPCLWLTSMARHPTVVPWAHWHPLVSSVARQPRARRSPKPSVCKPRGGAAVLPTFSWRNFRARQRTTLYCIVPNSTDEFSLFVEKQFCKKAAFPIERSLFCFPKIRVPNGSWTVCGQHKCNQIATGLLKDPSL